MDTKHRLDRSTVIALSVVGALIVLALVAVLIPRELPEPDLSTPEGVVQAYATAVLEGDEDTAAEWLTWRARRDCDPFSRASEEAVRVSVLSVVTRDDNADVRVLITSSSGSGLFGESTWESTETFELVAAPDGWLIEWAPWQLQVCP